jgi:hypothetical protein
MKIIDMSLEIFLLENEKIYLTGCENLRFYDSNGDPFLSLDKFTLVPAEMPKKILFRCPGEYCDQKYDNVFYADNDENFTLFVIFYDLFVS